MTNVIEVLQKRNFIDQLSDKQLKEIVNKPISCYVGFDPTADSLHIGHLVGVMALSWLKKHGHKAYALIGGATGRIGDPSGKSLERPFLDDKIILKNISSIRTFLEKVLGKDIQVVNNNNWFEKIKFTDFLRDIGKYFRIGPMLAKESVKLRMESQEGMSFTEFSYQILQSYDFYHLYKHSNITLQIGGSDQWGNITAGIELIRKLTHKTVYGMTFSLLTRADGKKFGKTESGAVWLDEKKLSYFDFYQYLIRVLDTDVIKLLKMLTFLSLEDINDIENQMRAPSYKPNTAQKILAKEVTEFIHGKEGLEIAQNVTNAAKPGSDSTLDYDTLKQISKDMPNINVTFSDIIGKKYTDIACQIGLTSSKSEALRLVKNSGAYLNNKKVIDPSIIISEKDLINDTFLLFGAGKKKRILVTIEKK
ncbi:MAG: Tyrosine--tRNA ligase [Candidatus Anoxychlamydiales bacterium]|nr:Tyrosine--tRNA ligase [Candidatus Anoxychlamydiales bacterium]